MVREGRTAELPWTWTWNTTVWVGHWHSGISCLVRSKGAFPFPYFLQLPVSLTLAQSQYRGARPRIVRKVTFRSSWVHTKLAHGSAGPAAARVSSVVLGEP